MVSLMGFDTPVDMLCPPSAARIHLALHTTHSSMQDKKLYTESSDWLSEGEMLGEGETGFLRLLGGGASLPVSSEGAWRGQEELPWWRFIAMSPCPWGISLPVEGTTGQQQQMCA